MKVISSDGTFKCTIPKEIAKKLALTRNDRLIWVFHKDKTIMVKKE